MLQCVCGAIQTLISGHKIPPKVVIVMQLTYLDDTRRSLLGVTTALIAGQTWFAACHSTLFLFFFCMQRGWLVGGPLTCDTEDGLHTQ